MSSAMCILLFCALSCATIVFAATTTKTSQDGVLKHRVWDGNLQGDVLVIHYSSLQKKAKTVHPLLKSSQECRDVCVETTGCTAWVYCNAAKGCGAGCKKYLTSYPPLKDVSKDMAFSDFVRPGPYDSLCQGDKWEHGVCTLKRITFAASLPAFNSNGGGFVSGTIELPPQCGANISARLCNKCHASSSPFACIGCASNLNARHPKGPTQVKNSLLFGGPVLGDSCANCYAKSSGVELCVKQAWGR